MAAHSPTTITRAQGAMLRTAAAAALAFIASPADAAGVPVDLELVLAVDVSSSMDLNEQRIQRDGYVEAFRSQELIDAITSGSYGRIAVTYFEWSGAGYQTVIVPWRIIATNADAEAVALTLEAAEVTRGTWTAISSALRFASRHFALSPAAGERRTIDISGDGPNNDGPEVLPTRDLLVEQGFVINGLPILIRPFRSSVPIDTYYEQCVIGGPGSFMIAANNPETFKDAIRRKLVLEVADAGRPLPLMVPVASPPTGPAVDCLAGEHTDGPGALPLGDR